MKIKEKVLKEEIEETKEQIRLILEEHPLHDVGNHREEYGWWINAIVNIKMVERAKFLVEVDKVIDEHIKETTGKIDNNYHTLETLKQKLGI